MTIANFPETNILSFISIFPKKRNSMPGFLAYCHLCKNKTVELLNLRLNYKNFPWNSMRSCLSCFVFFFTLKIYRVHYVVNAMSIIISSKLRTKFQNYLNSWTLKLVWPSYNNFFFKKKMMLTLQHQFFFFALFIFVIFCAFVIKNIWVQMTLQSSKWCILITL